MSVEDEYYSYLLEKEHQKDTVAKYYMNILRKMFAVGVTEEELLGDEIDELVEDYIKVADIHITNRAKGVYRSVIRRFRVFRGVSE